MRVNYTKNNVCTTCETTFPKEKSPDNCCGRKLRTNPKRKRSTQENFYSFRRVT